MLETAWRSRGLQDGFPAWRRLVHVSLLVRSDSGVSNPELLNTIQSRRRRTRGIALMGVKQMFGFNSNIAG